MLKIRTRLSVSYMSWKWFPLWRLQKKEVLFSYNFCWLKRWQKKKNMLIRHNECNFIIFVMYYSTWFESIRTQNTNMFWSTHLVKRNLEIWLIESVGNDGSFIVFIFQNVLNYIWKQFWNFNLKIAQLLYRPWINKIIMLY